jgi:hypothetical protein
MRKTLGVWTLACGLALMGMSGCKRHATPAPAQPVVRTLPPINAEMNFPVGSVPPAKVNQDISVAVRPRPRVIATQSTLVPQAETQAAIATEQERQDAILLQQQQSASQRQQEELNREIEQNVREQQRIQDEPRIQELPEVPISQPTPAPPQI